MAEFLVKLGDNILKWSTVSDEPEALYGSEEELRTFVKWEHGKAGLRELEKRLERLDKDGSSAYPPVPLEELLSGNRAGKDGTCMTFVQLVEFFGVERQSYEDPPVGRCRCNQDEEADCGEPE